MTTKSLWAFENTYLNHPVDITVCTKKQFSLGTSICVFTTHFSSTWHHITTDERKNNTCMERANNFSSVEPFRSSQYWNIDTFDFILLVR